MTIAARRAPIDQIGFVTADLDRAVRSWTERFGVGPWQIFRNVAMAGTCRGEATTVTMDVALGYRGGEQVELIEVTSQTASPYQDDAGRPLEGLHHLAWIVDDLAAERAALEEQGLVPVFHAANAAVEVVYFADPQAPGALFELIAGEGQREMHSEGLARAHSWDGREANLVIDFAAA